MHELTKKIEYAAPHSVATSQLEFLESVNDKIITDYLKEKAVVVFKTMIGYSDNNAESIREIQECLGLHDSLEERFLGYLSGKTIRCSTSPATTHKDLTDFYHDHIKELAQIAREWHEEKK